MGQLRFRNSETRAERLPPVCMSCGAATKDHVRKTFSWFPLWVYVTILAGVLPAFIVASVLTKHKRMEVPLCDEHRGHFRKRVIIFWTLVAIWMVMPIAVPTLIFLVGAISGLDDKVGAYICPVVATLLILMLVCFSAVMLAAKFTAIRPAEITDDGITLAGVHGEFIDALEENRERRRAKRDADEGE